MKEYCFVVRAVGQRILREGGLETIKRAVDAAADGRPFELPQVMQDRVRAWAARLLAALVTTRTTNSASLFSHCILSSFSR
jgi:hypothetical protein